MTSERYSYNSYKNSNNKNKELLSQYETNLKYRDRTPKTIYQYMSDLKAFICWLHDNYDDKYILDLKKSDFESFFVSIGYRTNISNARINRIQSSIRNLLNYCYLNDESYPNYQSNPMLKISAKKKVIKKRIVYLKDDQITYLINHFVKSKDFQKALWVSLSYDSAGRRNEVLQVEKTNFTTSFSTNKVVGKEDKTFVLFYSKRTQKLAKLYLSNRGKDNIKSLWVTGKGDKRHAIKYSTFYDWARKCSELINEKYKVNVKFGPHTFRYSSLENYKNGTHYFILNELKSNNEKVGLEILSYIAHHERVESTQEYIVSDKEKMLRKFFGSRKFS